MNVYVDAILFSSHCTFMNLTQGSESPSSNRAFSNKNIVPLLATSQLFNSTTPWLVMNEHSIFDTVGFDSLFILTESPTYQFTRQLQLCQVKDRHLEKIILPCKNLRSLEMKECASVLDENDALTHCLGNLVFLEELKIIGAFQLLTSSLCPAVGNMSYLRVLDLTACIELTDDFFIDNFTSSENNEHDQDGKIQHYKKKLRPNIRLESITVNFCDMLTAKTLQVIGDVFYDSLQSLSTSNAVGVVNDCSLEGLSHSNELMFLKKVNFSECFHVSDRGLESLGETLFQSNSPLERLNLANLRNISHLGIGSLFAPPSLAVASTSTSNADTPRFLSTLKYLNLNLCTNLDDSALFYLRDLESLEFLGLAETQVTDAGLETLAYSKSITSTLRELNCKRCLKLTENGCGKTLVQFKKLEILILIESGVSDLILIDHLMHMQTLKRVEIEVSDEVLRMLRQKQGKQQIHFRIEGEA